MRLRISRSYLFGICYGYKNILNTVTASCIVKALYSSSNIHNISVNRLKDILSTSFDSAKSIYVSALKLKLARIEGNDINKNMIFTSLNKKDEYGYVYVYAHIDHNGVHLYNDAGETPVFEKPQTFKEAKNVLLELAMCTKTALYNLADDSEEECNGDNYEEPTLYDLAQREDSNSYFSFGWSKYLTTKGYGNATWKLSTKVKDDKIKRDEQKSTKPLALSFIASSFFNKTQSISTIKRFVKHAVNCGLLKKYDNGRILVYTEADSSDYKNVDPKTSYLYDKDGNKSKLYFRVTHREMKINGDLKKAGSSQPKVTEAWKQPGMNSYAVKAVGVLDGLAKRERAAAFFF